MLILKLFKKSQLIFEKATKCLVSLQILIRFDVSQANKFTLFKNLFHRGTQPCGSLKTFNGQRIFLTSEDLMSSHVFDTTSSFFVAALYSITSEKVLKKSFDLRIEKFIIFLHPKGLFTLISHSHFANITD